MSQHHDRFGIQLREGDKVAYLSHRHTSSSLKVGRMVGATDCFVKLRVPHGYVKDAFEVIKVSPEKTVRAPEHLQSI